PKTRRLVKRLGRDADVLPIRLWCYVGKHYPSTGELPDHCAEDVEAEVSWRGRRGQAVEAMIEVGLIEKIENGFRVHDWMEWSGHLKSFKERAKKGAKARWAKIKDPVCDASSNASSNACASIDSKQENTNGASPNVHQRAESPTPPIEAPKIFRP